MATKVLPTQISQRWPDGRVPYEVPFAWAASDALLSSVDEAITQLNRVLRGHVAIVPRRTRARDYLVLRVTAQAEAPRSVAPGCHGGAQDLYCQVGSIADDPTPLSATLMRGFLRALGVPIDFMPLGECPLTPCVIELLKQMYPSPHCMPDCTRDGEPAVQSSGVTIF